MAQEQTRGDKEHLKDVSTHYEFGKNWSSFASLVSEEREAQAINGLSRLLETNITGKTFLDIGSGSGLSSLAAAHLGARRILAIDIDPDSVSTTRNLLAARVRGADWDVREASVFDLDQEQAGRFDIVYSWGVLHHTGSMWEAIGRAATFVEPGGRLVLALYVKTRFCRLWAIEKRIYTNGSAAYRKGAEVIYKGLVILSHVMRGRSPDRVAKEHYRQRGMDLEHDVRDWLGGYPYESASAAEVIAGVERLGFVLKTSSGTKPNFGLFGSGCAEYVFERIAFV